MSAVAGSGIGPISVRYAAQIRELLQSQAMDRMVAEEEAARAAAQAEKAQRMKPPEEPVKIEIDSKLPEPVKPADGQPDPLEPSSKGTAQFVDIQV